MLSALILMARSLATWRSGFGVLRSRNRTPCFNCLCVFVSFGSASFEIIFWNIFGVSCYPSFAIITPRMQSESCILLLFDKSNRLLSIQRSAEKCSRLEGWRSSHIPTISRNAATSSPRVSAKHLHCLVDMVLAELQSDLPRFEG